MKDNKGLLALMGMAAMFSEVGYTQSEKPTITKEQLERYNQRQEANKKKSYEKRMLSKGLKKFTFSNMDIWALNYNSAKRKAKKKGFI